MKIKYKSNICNFLARKYISRALEYHLCKIYSNYTSFSMKGHVKYESVGIKD